MDIAQHCRTLSEFHGGTDLAERVRSALDIQREQRLALAQAADEIERLNAELAKLQARDASSVG
jgi:antirestriction protein ArdC